MTDGCTGLRTHSISTLKDYPFLSWDTSTRSFSSWVGILICLMSHASGHGSLLLENRVCVYLGYFWTLSFPTGGM